MASLRQELEADPERVQGYEGAPAARSCRVTRRPLQATDEKAAADVPPPPAPAKHSAVPHGAAGGGILGNVQEREVQPPALPSMVASALPFPKATHRRQSKFSLGRKSAARGPPERLLAPALPAQPNSDCQGTTASQQAVEPSPATASAAPHSLTTPAFAASTPAEPNSQEGIEMNRTTRGGQLGSLMDWTASRMHADITQENAARLADMGTAQVVEAQAELAERFSAETLAFLRKRGAAKARPAEVAAKAGTTMAAAPCNVAAAGQVSEIAHSTEEYDGHTAFPDASASTQRSDRPSQGRWRPAATDRQQAGPEPQFLNLQADQGRRGIFNTAADQVQLPQQLASTLRFDLEGHPDGLHQGDKDDVQPQAQATLRDPLRMDEGSVGQGLTVQEAVQLLRSSLPAQQVAALRTISAILVQARPAGIRHPDAPISAPTPSAFVAERGITWRHVWEAALGEAEVAVALRLALDSSHAQVVAAAAAAVCALLGANDASPSLGVPTRCLTRLHPTAAWEVNLVAMPPPAAGPEAAEDVPDERTVARTDPLVGLLRMQVVERLAYILGAAHLQAAVPSCLSLLGCLARAGVDAARAVWRGPGMPGLLMRHVRTGHTAADFDASAEAGYARRRQAMKALCDICKWNPAAALDLRDAGITDVLTRALLMGGSLAEAQAPLSPSQQLFQVEALRLWSIFAQQDIPMHLSLDDVYPALCHLFLAPGTVPAPDGAAMAGSAAGRAAELEAELAATALETAAALASHSVRQPGSAMVSPACAAALSQELLTWLHKPQVEAALRESHTGNGRLEAGWRSQLRCSAAAQQLLAAVATMQPQAWLHNVQSALVASRLLSTQFWTSILLPTQAAEGPNPKHPAARQDAHGSQQPTTHLFENSKLQMLSATLQLGNSLLTLPAGFAASPTASAGTVATPQGLLAPVSSDSRGSHDQSNTNEGTLGGPAIDLALMASLDPLCELVVAAVRSEFLQQPAISLQNRTIIQEGDAPAMARQQLLSQLLAVSWQLQDRMASVKESCPVHTDQSNPNNAHLSQCVSPAAMHKPSMSLPRPSEAMPHKHAQAAMTDCGALPDAQANLQHADTIASMPAQSLLEHPKTSISSAGTQDTLAGIQGMSSPAPCTQQQQQPASGATRGASRMELLVHVWSVMPPGLETEAFRLLDLASQPQYAAAVLAAAESRLKADQASSRRPCMMVSARLSVGGQRGPSQMAHLPTAEEARLHWLHGYAAAWLGLEAAQEEAGTAKKRVSKVAKARQPPRQLARVCPRPDGSRLPAPPLWPLLDIHPAPQAAPASQCALASISEHSKAEVQHESTGSTPDNDPALARLGALGNAAAGALLLQLGHQSHWAHQDADAGASVGREQLGIQVKAIIDLLLSADSVSAEAEPWADMRIRALSACLMDTLLSQPGALPSLAACIRDSDATAWAEQLAAVSYGDPFFGACVSLTLLPCMLPEVQISTLQTLAEQRSLHLLPAPKNLPLELEAWTGQLPHISVLDCYADLAIQDFLKRSMLAAPYSLPAALAIQHLHAACFLERPLGQGMQLVQPSEPQSSATDLTGPSSGGTGSAAFKKPAASYGVGDSLASKLHSLKERLELGCSFQMMQELKG
ncbi:hypothetical protein WJX74_001891 [Apatococcus lobatus]|uniref:Uncharacterized protein n=1 Tax=Apatococcus lobatus TaxID=904363 RepID=A0AAW1S686_9CHLO